MPPVSAITPKLAWLPQFPGIHQLRHYQRSWLPNDVLAGVTVAAYLIPQCMAYGELAGVDPIVGLWAILPPLLIYAFLGSSPQLSVGPESTTAVMTAVAIAPLANGSNYAPLAAALAFGVGLVCLLGYMLRLGFLANLLSKPILVGYMAGVALIMIAGQLGKISGINISAQTVIGQGLAFIRHLDQIHGPTLLLGLLVLVFLGSIQSRFPTAPGPLLAVLLATLTSTLLHLNQQGVAVVGTIPAGLPQFTLPFIPKQDWLTLGASAIGIAIVGYSDNVLTARIFATRHRYPIDANQELLALGIANLGNGLLQGFPISSSGSRTVIGDALGSRSQVFSLVAFGVVMSVLLFLRPLLALFPTAALGAIVVYAATRLIDLAEFRRLSQFRTSELALALVTTLGVLATDILIGVAVAISLSVIDLFARLARPHDAVLGKVPGLSGLHDIADWEGATTLPGLVLYRYDAPLCFANVENFKRRALQAIADEVAPVHWFVLSTEAISEVDITAADALADLYEEVSDQGITFALTRVKQELYGQLQHSGLLDAIGPERVYPTLSGVIEAFQSQHPATPDG
ncbi:sulfate permease [Synechococcales cyanobacterium C]|uniref:Sulfate permease n=1 Tax=Petrachloros mirabilis ULC683 TaxID=2781853 RepID=A0A8K2A7F9_9CYAN|nr:sulfate permease [Petrachloros mirabilis]NCJ06040.1 sulfate permease [Petrachloros mirabilis ULC683]